MSRGRKVLLSSAAAVAMIPVAIVVAGNGNFITGNTVRQTISWSGTQSTNSTQWKPVGGIANPIVTPDPAAFTVNAQMTKGAAKFRIVRVEDNAVRPPGPVKFSAKAANSFTWATVDSCGQGEQHVLQWKRSGPDRAVAAKLSTHAVWDDFCL